MFAVFMLSGLFTFLADLSRFHLMWNAIWMFGIPALLGILLNQGKPRQVIMTFALMVASLVSVMATSTYFGMGY
jgi:hypothetical protein